MEKNLKVMFITETQKRFYKMYLSLMYPSMMYQLSQEGKFWETTKSSSKTLNRYTETRKIQKYAKNDVLFS